MKENQNKPKSENLVHFDSFEETVIRGNSPEKEAVKKVLKKKLKLPEKNMKKEHQGVLFLME